MADSTQKLSEVPMKWQLSLDVLSVSDALALCEATADYVDVIEIGTPLIVSEGATAVRQVREHYPNKEILADTKLMDGVSYLAPLLYDAGADVITVMAATDDYCLATHARLAHERNKLAEADLMGISHIEERVGQLLDLGIDLFEVHPCSESLRPHELRLHDIKRTLSAAPAEIVTVAHSFTFDSVTRVLPLRPGTICLALPFLYETDRSKWSTLAKKARALFDSEAGLT
jgi:3-hexulose-6-phosphate synthase